MAEKDENNGLDIKEMSDESENLTEKLEDGDLNSVVGGEASIGKCYKSYCMGVCHTVSMDDGCPNLILTGHEMRWFSDYRLNFTCSKGYFKNARVAITIKFIEKREFEDKLRRFFR